MGSASTKPTRLIPYSGWFRNFRAISCPTSPAPTITAFCRYVTLRRAMARVEARPRETKPIAAAQNSTSFGAVGWASPVRYAPTEKIHVQTVTMWKTPAKSSAVEWSVRSSSRS